ncbi:MAG: DUF5610 domain-containing protein [Motiliproteus sp.]|nr:DUF5610 domain-containing protein [Motiliproteus sp.]MCW9051636.1 DUF5610 domain-containing protein [Motiliproteus sp.]
MYISFNSNESFFRQQNFLLSSNGHADGRDNGGRSVAATDRVLDKLAEKIPGMSAGEMRGLSAEQFSPEKVSNRIADFVSQGLEQARRDGKSETEVQKLYEQAVKGIEQGFNEARDILEDMSLLSDELSETIDTTFDLTMEKVDALAPIADEEEQGLTSTSMLAAERYQESESFSLKLRTQDGDKVVVKFDSSSSYEASFGAYSDDEASAVSFSIDRSQSSNYRFSVEGELDEGEIDAIQELIQDVSLIADDFFDGDVQAAFDQASQYQMDKTELASMHLRLTQSQEYSSVAAYQQVQDMGEQQQPGRKLGHMLQGLRDGFSNPALGFLQSPFGFGQDLLSNLIPQDNRYQQAEREQQSLFDQNLNSLRDILDTFSTSEVESDDND